mgnify:CR=1 FL=1
MYSLQQTAAPAEEPVSLTEAKLWLRVETSADDSLISSLVTAARGMVEKLAGRQLVTAQWVLRLDTFPYPNGWWILAYPGLFPDPMTIRVPKAPLQSVEGITYYDLGGTLQTLDPRGQSEGAGQVGGEHGLDRVVRPLAGAALEGLDGAELGGVTLVTPRQQLSGVGFVDGWHVRSSACACRPPGRLPSSLPTGSGAHGRCARCPRRWP